MSRRYNIYPPDNRTSRHIGGLIGRILLNGLFFLVVFGCTYLFFNLFDTTRQYRQRGINNHLKSDYSTIESRYDTVSLVLDNVIERDKNVFRILFESEPYDFVDNTTENSWSTRERLAKMDELEVHDELNSRLNNFETEQGHILALCNSIANSVDSLGSKINNIPAIQPIINKNLTLLTAPYGMLIHPFYKTLVSHQGVDFTVPEGSRVFATADGKVTEVKNKTTTSGKYVVIKHGTSGYTTQYNHLSRINVKVGQNVKRGDIIGLTGNTGLSLTPHLHYEVKYKDMRVDPVHYFFMELTPSEYQRMIKISQSGMQSFD